MLTYYHFLVRKQGGNLVKIENLSSKVFDENRTEERKIMNQFIDFLKDDIIVIKTEGDNDGNFRDERTKDKDTRYSVRK